MEIDFSYFERILAMKSMTDGAYLSSIADYVKPEYFEDEAVSNYFSIVKEFYDNRKTLPTLTEIKSYLTTEGDRIALRKLVESFKDLDRKLNEEELYANTEAFLKERATWCNILDIAQNSETKAKNPAAVLEQFEKICAINLKMDRGFELFDDIDILVDDILTDDSVIPLLWDNVDDVIGGGLMENGKALYVFAGQANIGKSIFLGNVAANIARQGKTVLIVSLEMSEKMYAQRICSNITKIPMREFKYEAQTLRHAVNEHKKKVPEGKIFIKEFPPSTITVNQLSGFIKKLEDSGEKIDAIVIDYLNLLESTKGNNSYERIKHVCEQLRALSYIYSCPVVTATQLNRSSFNVENPGMEGLSESIGVAATADVIWSIFQTEADMELGIIRLGQIKNRFGMRGMVFQMKIDYPTLSIIETGEAPELMENDDEENPLDKFAM